MYTKEQIKKLKDESAIPVEIVGNLDIRDKKAQIFDILSSYKSQTFLTFIIYPDNDKGSLETYQLKDLVEHINIVYAIVPVSIQTYKELINNVI